LLPFQRENHSPHRVDLDWRAQSRHARVALGLGQLQAVVNEAELEWPLVRREAYDSLSARVQVQTTQRSRSEPRATPAGAGGATES